MSNEKKEDIFAEYNRAEKLPEGGLKNRAQVNTHPKAKAIVKIIKQVEEDIRKKSSDIFDNFNVEFKFTSADSSKYSNSITDAMGVSKGSDSNKTDLVIPINFNFTKLGKFPPEEIYCIVYAVMYDSLLKKKDKVLGNQGYSFGKNVGNQPAVNDAHVDRSGNYIETSEMIFDYIKKILRILLGDELGQDRVNDLIENSGCARDISNNLKALGSTEKSMFENPNGQNLLAERYGKVIKQGYMHQATHLLGEISKNEFEALKTNDEAQIKNFCEKYARITLSQCNISSADVQITFEPNGDVGSYWDYGTSQKVNINISEIMKIKNPAEVVMTLTHELKHAIDSTANKFDGKTTDKGYGLLDNLVGDPSRDLDKVDGEFLDLLREVNMICYRLNPNERTARVAELAAIKFMQGIQPDKSMQGYIDKSIATYETYQNSVISSMRSIEGKKLRYEQLKSSMSKSVQDIFEERFNYLDNLKEQGRLNEEQERETIRIALDAKDKIKRGEGLQIEGEQLEAD